MVRWKNVQALNIKTHDSVALPIFNKLPTGGHNLLAFFLGLLLMIIFSGEVLRIGAVSDVKKELAAKSVQRGGSKGKQATGVKKTRAV